MTTDLARIARRAAWMMINASIELHRTDLAVAGLVIADGNQMNAMYDDMEQLCITLLALQAPVAGDQRFSDRAVAIAHQVCYLTAERKPSTTRSTTRACGRSAFLRGQLGTELVRWLSRSAHVRAAERGEIRPISTLEPANAATLDAMRAVVDNVAKGWGTYQRQAIEFDLRNTVARANDRTGCDLGDQVDPEFGHGLGALARSGQLPSGMP